MDFSLNDRQKHLVRQVRELVEQEIKPYVLVNSFSRQQEFDWYLVNKLSELNLVCPTIPEEYGGLGLDIFTTALVIEEIAAGCPGLAAVVDTNVHAAQPILLAGSSSQKERYLPLLTGKDVRIASFALTEPSGGSDINSMHTYANKTKQGFVLNGCKDYIFNAPQAAFISVFAMTDKLHKKASLRCFIIPVATPGVTIGKIRDIAALEYAHMAEIIFDNAVIDSDMIIKLDESYSGYLLLSQTFDIGRVVVGATSVGIARAAYDMAYEYAENRLQFGKKIKNHQAVAHTLVEMATRIEMARLMTWKACWLIDQGDDYTIASAMAKLSASVIAQEVTGMAADILASRAFERGTLAEQLLRDARVLSTVEGTNCIQRNIIASLL
ncbi:butyryl-coa dehydrogenase [hydrocarbon metagenome]|uniref:Butyryl-coa dehydrogenase n=1 Tax=hydrocarbon metagenome TaxID=938273 RepID=A0A0W8E3G7_9ZZZZ